MKQLQRTFNTRITERINTTLLTIRFARDRLAFLGGDRLQERTTGKGKAKPSKSSARPKLLNETVVLNIGPVPTHFVTRHGRSKPRANQHLS